MNWTEGISITTVLLVLFLVILPITIAIYLYFYDKSQKQHAILRNFPILGRMRYVGKTGPNFANICLTTIMMANRSIVKNTCTW